MDATDAPEAQASSPGWPFVGRTFAMWELQKRLRRFMTMEKVATPRRGTYGLSVRGAMRRRVRRETMAACGRRSLPLWW